MTPLNGLKTLQEEKKTDKDTAQAALDAADPADAGYADLQSAFDDAKDAFDEAKTNTDNSQATYDEELKKSNDKAMQRANDDLANLLWGIEA